MSFELACPVDDSYCPGVDAAMDTHLEAHLEDDMNLQDQAGTGKCRLESDPNS